MTTENTTARTDTDPQGRTQEQLVMRDAETGILMPLRMDFASLNDFAFTPDVDFEEMQAALVGAGTELDRLQRNATEAYQYILELEAENKKLTDKATYRSARMQIIREWMLQRHYKNHTPPWDLFARDYVGAGTWFDEEGVPE